MHGQHFDFDTNTKFSIMRLQCLRYVELTVAARRGYISAATVSEIGLYRILGCLSAVIVRVHVKNSTDRRFTPQLRLRVCVLRIVSR